MKKFFYLLIGVMLLTASCSNDSETDLYTEIAKNEEAMREAVSTKARGTYELVWLMYKHPVDTATFSTELDPYYSVITHFPIKFFMTLFHHDKISQIKENESLFEYKYDKSSYWLMDLSFAGYSANNAYMSNKVWAPRTYFECDGVEYACQIWFNTTNMAGDQTALIYDVEKDVWSGTAVADSMSIINLHTKETRTLKGPEEMLFQTTGRKQK